MLISSREHSPVNQMAKIHLDGGAYIDRTTLHNGISCENIGDSCGLPAKKLKRYDFISGNVTLKLAGRPTVSTIGRNNPVCPSILEPRGAVCGNWYML